MENYLVVLILSVFVLLGALYVHTVDQNIVQIKDELLQHGNEIKKVKLELEWTRNELKQAQVEYKSTSKKITEMKVELESTKKEVEQMKVELESTRKELTEGKIELESTRKELTKVKVELDTTKEQIDKMRKEIIEKDSAGREEINKIRSDVNALREEINKIKTELHTQIPGFYATLSSTTTLGQSQRIEFDQVITDVTNNYNKITGVFTVPKNGLYHFSSTMFSYSGNFHAEIMQNHLVIGRNHGTSAYVSAAINVVISCKQGDSIFVRHMAEESIQNIYGYGYAAFSGFLIN